MKKKLATLKKTFVLQHGQTDCGPACLASILQYYGASKTLEELRQLTGTTKTGSTLLGLYQGAHALGFEAEGLEAESVDNLHELEGPAILHVMMQQRLRHYVVFYGFEGEQLIIGEPGTGVALWSKEQLADIWQSKSLLSLTPTEKLTRESTAAKPYQKLLDWVKEDVNILLAALFLGVMIAVFSLSTAVFSQKLIDVILPSNDLTKLVVGLILFGFILLMKSGVSYVRSTFLISQSRDFNNRMIASFFQSLLDLPKAFFDNKKKGEMIARMNDTSRIQSTISSLVGNLLIEFLVIMVSLVGVLLYSWQLGLVVLAFVPVYVAIIWRLNKPIHQAQQEVMTAYAGNESNYIDVISGIAEVKSTGNIGLFHRSTTAFYRAFQDRIFGLGKIRIKFGVLTDFVGAFLILSVISYASYMVLIETLQLGTMMAILSLSGTIGPSLARIAMFNIQFQEAQVAFNRMAEFTGMEQEANQGKVVLGEVREMAIKGLDFTYPGTLGLLKDFHLRVQKGEMVTLLGESGSGKSTLLQLIQGFYTPNQGSIAFDGVPLAEVEINSLRTAIGVVPQEVKIFNNYLAFNIALTENVEELQQVEAWCKAHGFDQFFSKFPQGYLTLLGEEGVNISGGQKQLVALARVLYRQPKLLLIDEGTSAMDRATENHILNILHQLKARIPVLVVTHRIKVASLSDRIYLLEGGTISHTGSPEELREFQNFYSEGYRELLPPQAQDA